MKKIFQSLLLLAAIIGLVGCGSQTKESSEQIFNQKVTQTVASGKVKGQKDKENQAIEWLGIPYAQSPEGDLRWKSPKEVKAWKGTFEATKAGNKAVQLSNGKISGSEDALNLDVVRPDSKDKNLPVIVFLHGGNNQTGSAQEIKGNSFVKDVNAVYVSLNYRLGPLGFNPLKALKGGSKEEDSGNYTLLDIAAALDWVRANVEAFGGDKDNITLTGFSAGGRDVMAALISPIFKGKFHKAISFSGGMTLADEAESQAIFAAAIAPLAVEDGIKATEKEAKAWLLSDDKAVADYLKGVKAERLAGLMGNAAIRMSVFPHLYKDGTVLPEEGFGTKAYNDVPLMLVTGTSEFSLFAAYDPYFAKEFTDQSLFSNAAKLAEYQYAKSYGGAFYRLANGVESARIMDEVYQSDIFISEISYGSNAEVTAKLAPSLGAFHGIFEPLLQRPSNYEAILGDDFYNDGESQLSSQFKTYLKNFLTGGEPGSGWQAWTADRQEVLSLDADKHKAQISMSTDKATAEEIVAKMEADDSLSAEQKKLLNETVLNGRWFSGVLDSSDFSYDNAE